MKRILFINYDFPPLGGGSGNAMFYLLKEFSQLSELSVTAVAASPTNQEQIINFSPQVKIHQLPIGNKLDNLHQQTIWNLILYSFRLFKFLKKELGQNNYSLNFTYFTYPCGLISFLFKNKVPYILFLRGSDVPFHNKKNFLLDALFLKHVAKFIWRHAYKVIANSYWLKNEAHLIAPRQTIAVIPNGVNLEIFHPSSPQEKNGFQILSVTRLIKIKGIKYLLDGFALFHKKYPLSRLIIAGSGPQEHYLKKLAARLNISQSAIFLPHLSHQQLPQLYQVTDVFISPSFNEGMSNALLEAMACSLPIISTDTGDVRQLLEKNVIIVPAKNGPAICQALEQLYLNKNQYQQMALASRQQAEKLSWQRIAQQYLNLLNNHD